MQRSVAESMAESVLSFDKYVVRRHATQESASKMERSLTWVCCLALYTAVLHESISCHEQLA